jgi:DNA-binding beta-propeller fold protein YncE
MRSPLVLALLVALLAPAAAGAAPYSDMKVIGKRAEGVLRFPQASAVGPDGSVYVADQLSHTIQVFGPDGVFRREIGAAGDGPGGLSSVGGVAVGPDGSVYVADGADRVDRFAADGSLLNSWGSSGDAVGEFHFGAGGGNDSGAGGGVAVGGGYVYVADTRNNRVQRFNADGTGGVVLVGPGEVLRPQGLAVSADRLIVADDLNHRLVAFDLGGHPLATIGSGPGPRPNQLRNPYDVAIDPLGRVFVADNSNHRVVRYGPAPAYRYRARWGAFGSRAGQLQYPSGLSVDASGRTFVADPGGNRIDVFDVGGDPQGSFGESGRVAGQFIAPVGVGADASGVRAVADSVNGRIQLLNPDGGVAAMFGAPAPGPTLLPDPVAVAFDAAGKVYVLDQRRSRVLVFDRAGKILRTIGSQGSGPGKLLGPSALAIAGTSLYVADTGNWRIVRFSTNGTYLGTFCRFNTIRGIAVTPDGSRIYGADAGTDSVIVLSGSGGDLAEIGSGELRDPGQIALDGAGNVWVADTRHDRVIAFTPDGTPLLAFGERGVGPGQFVEPTGVTVDCHGLVTVAEEGNNRVQQFQFPPTIGCGALPPVKNPPDPIIAPQPQPPPPLVSVVPTRSTGILGIRQFPLRVNTDLPCKISVVVTLTPRSGKKTSASARLTQSLPAGKTLTVRPRFSAASVSQIKRVLKGRRGLVATVRVTAKNADAAPTVVTKRVQVTG